jgi:hypothetical protein
MLDALALKIYASRFRLHYSDTTTVVHQEAIKETALLEHQSCEISHPERIFSLDQTCPALRQKINPKLLESK